MSVLPVGFGSSGGIDVGDIGHSLRFRGAQYLSKVFSVGVTDTSVYIKTYSFWVKRSEVSSGTTQVLLSCWASAADFWQIAIDTADNLVLYSVATSAVACHLTSTRKFRDPTAWMHVCVSIDSTQVVAADRVTVKVNNETVALTVTTQLALNSYTMTNLSGGGTWTAYVGNRGDLGYYNKGYLSRLCIIDGTALTPSSFGQLNTEINEWVTKSQSAVKAVVDAGGTNSFMLDFDDATSLTTLGYDKSSKGNNWTLNNFSLTAGTTYDHMLDVPGNSYATLNPLKPQGTPTLADGNLSHTRTAVTSRSPGSISISASDLAYFEFVRTDAVGVANNVAFGITATDAALSTSTYGGSPTSSGATASEWVLTDRGYACNGSTYTNLTATLGTFGQNDVGRVAVNRVTGKVWFGKNTTWSGDPAAGTGEAFSNVTVNVQPLSYVYSGTMHFNTGQRPLAQSAPTGFKALCQANLPTGTVTVSGTFTGNASADGPCVWMNGVPKTLTINGNAVTFGTHADKLATGFKLRTSSSSYNTAGSNTWTATIDSNLQNIFKYNNAEGNP